MEELHIIPFNRTHKFTKNSNYALYIHSINKTYTHDPLVEEAYVVLLAVHVLQFDHAGSLHVHYEIGTVITTVAQLHISAIDGQRFATSCLKTDHIQIGKLRLVRGRGGRGGRGSE